MPPEYSLEFFPPRSEEGWNDLRAALPAFAALAPRYGSVTFGAGGSTQAGTLEAVRLLRDGQGLDAAPHLSCVNATRDGHRALLAQYRELGVRRIVALRGDLPSGVGLPAGDFRYAAELVGFIRAETGDHFHIEVAAYPEMHPQARSPQKDFAHFCDKVRAGANGAITQYFYNAHAYFDFVDRCESAGLGIPVVPGIMPITNFRQLARFSDICGAEIPRWIRLRLEALEDDLESLREFGREVVLSLCETLLEGGAPGLHFYTLNRLEPTRSLLGQLRS